MYFERNPSSAAKEKREKRKESLIMPLFSLVFPKNSNFVCGS